LRPKKTTAVKESRHGKSLGGFRMPLAGDPIRDHDRGMDDRLHRPEPDVAKPKET